MLHRLYSSDPSFKTLAFAKGLNVLVAEMATGATERQSRISLKTTADLAASIVMIVAGIVVTWKMVATAPRPEPPTRPAPKPPVEPVSLAGLPQKGDPSAPFVLVEFADFECPYCRRFAADVLPEIEEKFVKSGKLSIAFAHFPIDAIHAQATRAAHASECAARQQKFWEAHAAIFEKPKVTTDLLDELPSRLGLDGQRFTKCLKDEAPEQIRRSVEVGENIGVSVTPSFLLGRQVPGGVQVSRIVPGLISFRTVQTFVEESKGLIQEAPNR
jgi:protein-disulfide isomerase